MYRSLCIALALCFGLLAASPVSAAIDALLLRYPDVSENEIAFVYGGDIWLVPKQGGQAHRLSTPSGEEAFPRFSPDGSRLAFSGNYDGNNDIYVVPTSGGVPVRVTHHPMGDRMLDWYPGGDSILFASSRASGKQRFNQFYEVSADGGLPSKLVVPYGEFGSISPDGKLLAYQPVSRDFRTWKRYRGGTAPEIWIFNLKDHSARNVTQNDANDGQPMWHGSTLYFLSDRDANRRANIWAYDTKAGTTRQITTFKDYDVRFPAIGPSDMVFECGGRLYRMSLADEKVSEVNVEVVTDRATLKPYVKSVRRNLQDGNISPSGKRAVIQARGEIFTLPEEHGVVMNVSHSPGAAERHPAWSPDGKEIAYFSDRSGEYELTVRPADGTGVEERLTRLGPGFRYQIFWSPDSRKLAFIDQSMTIQYFDRDSDKLTEIDQALDLFEGGLRGFGVSWSADSRWIAYSRALESRASVIFLYDTKESKLHQATSAFYSDSNPVFDPDGKYLYLTTARTFRPVYSDLDNSFVYPNTTSIAAIPLRKDVASPLAPRNDVEGDDEDDDDKNGDDENGDDENGDDGDGDDGDGDDGDDDKGEKGKGDDDKQGDKGKGGKKKKDGKKDKPEPVEIDLEGFESRIVILPPDPGNYGNLSAVSGKVIYRRFPRSGSGGESSPIVYYDLEEREEKTVMDDADGFAVSANGKKMLVASNGEFGIIKVAEKQKMKNKLRLEEMEMTIDPGAEWKQIFNDVWRIERDYFYDPNLHGVDWDEMRKRYGKLLDDAVTRWDVNFIIGELIAELSASHAYRGGGDTERSTFRRTGLLGADYSLENGAYRIKKIVRAAPWESEVRSPLAEPGVDVKEGDYLLAVNGAPVDTSKDPWAAFEGVAGETVMLTVNDKPEMEGSRTVLVEPLSSETRLRNLAWIESNRKRVEEATDGRVGYIYVPDTGFNGQNELVRQFQPQFTKDGLIIDERFNSGGQIPDRFVELLNRPLYNYWGVRDGMDWQWPPVAHAGPKVMLINEWSGSGGDAFPFYFKAAGLGPLIGTRTWGGLIGISGAPGLIDDGGATVPTFGIYSLDGEWIIENHGVEPDIEVIDDPSLMADGGDPQLDRAIEEILRLLERNPPVRPKRPEYPRR